MTYRAFTYHLKGGFLVEAIPRKTPLPASLPPLPPIQNFPSPYSWHHIHRQRNADKILFLQYAKDNTNHASGTAVVALIFIYYAFYNLMMPLAYCYITEVFPFQQRSKGVAIMQLFSRGGSAFNQFVNPIGLEAIQWRFYLVYVVWLAVETGVIFVLYPETKGPSLEEVAMVMDREANVERVEVGGLAKRVVGEVREVESVGRGEKLG
jgi:MFS family permease